MAVTTGYRVRPVVSGDRDQLAHLIFNESSVHRHLDWRTPLEWIGYPPYLAIEQNGRIKSVLACPPDPPGIGWVRVFATEKSFLVQNAWNILWANVLSFLKGKEGTKVAVITLQNWYREILECSNFSIHQQIVMLTWMGKIFPEVKQPAGFLLRNMDEMDIPRVAEVDASAFDPLWQNSPNALCKAFGQAALATVIEVQGIIVGYQLSTKNPLGGHLARLAVLPEQQSKGIGYFLVTDMICQLTRSGVHSISVNTQSDNLISLSLYKKIGFSETGERFPVYEYEVK
jgi:ribosomal-protein-alanine N-acetyltransferase